MTATKPVDHTIGVFEFWENLVLADHPVETWPYETWLDLIWHQAPPDLPEPPADALLTRDQFLTELDRRGVELSEANLVRWEQLHLLPRPVRRWHNGATRAVYHPRLVDQAEGVRVLLDSGYSRDQIAIMFHHASPWLATWLATWPADVSWDLPWQHAIDRVPETIVKAVSNLVAAYTRLATPPGKITAARLTLLDQDSNEVKTLDMLIDLSGR